MGAMLAQAFAAEAAATAPPFITPSRSQVADVMAALHPQGQAIDRRHDRRYPLARLLRITPLTGDRVAPAGPAVVVAGKDLSERGLSFFHPQPLAHRAVLVELELDASRTARFVLDVSWCRFLRAGWYESGGRFVDRGPSAS